MQTQTSTENAVDKDPTIVIAGDLYGFVEPEPLTDSKTSIVVPDGQNNELSFEPLSPPSKAKSRRRKKRRSK